MSTEIGLDGNRIILDDRITELNEILKPVIRKDNKLYYIEPVDPARTAFTWNPVTTDEAIDLEEYSRVPFFSWSLPSLWKPSIKEVFVEIQDNSLIIENCVAFEVVHSCIDEEGRGHLGVAIFYKKKDFI